MIDKWLMGAFLSVIGKCNYNCIYCSANDQITSNRILSIEEFEHIICIFEQKHLCKLNITGGEPFLHRDIEKIINTSISKFSVNLLTNGSLIKDHIQFLSEIEKKNRLRFSVSLDSGNPIVNRLTRGEGAFERSFEGIKLLIELGYQVSVLCTITNSYSIEELNTLIKTIYKIGGKQVILTPLQPMGLAKEQFDKLRPSNKLLDDLLEVIPKMTKKYGVNIGVGFEKCYNEKTGHSSKPTYLLPCKAGITQISVRVNGDVYPCNTLEVFMGNILNDSIDFILNDSEGAIKIKQLTQCTIQGHSMCNNCKYEKECTGGCRGIGYGYTDDLCAPSIYCDQLKSPV